MIICMRLRPMRGCEGSAVGLTCKQVTKLHLTETCQSNCRGRSLVLWLRVCYHRIDGVTRWGKNEPRPILCTCKNWVDWGGHDRLDNLYNKCSLLSIVCSAWVLFFYVYSLQIKTGDWSPHQQHLLHLLPRLPRLIFWMLEDILLFSLKKQEVLHKDPQGSDQRRRTRLSGQKMGGGWSSEYSVLFLERVTSGFCHLTSLNQSAAHPRMS